MEESALEMNASIGGHQNFWENKTMKEAVMFRKMPDDYTWFFEVTDTSKVCKKAYRI